MSEYQYHEWQAVDRILTEREQQAVSRLSSHIEVSPSRAVVTYHWSDFRYDPKRVLLDYFDGYFYLANWGSLRLMFRFPKGLLDEADVDPYCIGDYVSFMTSGNYQVLDLDFNPEDGGYWEETDAGLSDFIHLRSDLLDGDYRLLYLAWLKTMTFDYEPPVPAGLKTLSPPLQNFVQVFGIDPFLVQAAAEASPSLKKALAVDYADLVSRLPREECDDFLRRLAEGDAGVGLALRKRLGAFLPQERLLADKPRTFEELLQRAEVLKNAEKMRRAEEARQQHINEMRDLANRETQVWQQVDTLLENGRKIASVYDEATSLLDKLKQLSEFQDAPDLFAARVRQLAQKYASRPSLIERWKRRGWV